MRSVLIGLLRLLPAAGLRHFCGLCVDALATSPSRRALKELLLAGDHCRHALDACAIAVEGGLHPKHRLMKYHDFFVQRLQPGERVVDIGCGIGAVADSMARAGAKVVGIDMNAESIERARQRYPNMQFIIGEAPGDLPAGPFDTVVLSNVLEHIRDRVGFLRRVQDRMNPRRLLIRVPLYTRDWTVPLKEGLGLFPYSDPSHFTEYTVAGFRIEMDAAGMHIVTVEVNWGEILAEVRPMPARVSDEAS